MEVDSHQWRVHRAGAIQYAQRCHPACPPCPGRSQVRLSAVVEKSDVDEVQALVDFILKSDPSAHETRRPSR